jgi:iron-sulfur cluster assembly protein
MASREPVLPPAESPVNVTERAARAVKDIVNEQRLQVLGELAPELVDVYKSFVAKEGHGPALAELANAANLSEQALLAKLGAAAFSKPENIPQEYRELQRELAAANGHAPTPAELAARAGISEPELLAKVGSSASTILGRVFLRLRVVGGGCSGFEHKLDLDPTMNPKVDEEFDMFGVPVAIDKRSLMYISGVVVDYHNDLNRRGFSITNPNAKTTCGCGSSFSM